MCKVAPDNLLLNTVKIDSVEHLGLNKGPRFTLQYWTYCAPLVTKGYKTYNPLPGTSRYFI